MNNVEFLKVYAENFADCTYEKAITKKLEKCLPVLFECTKFLDEAIEKHSPKEFDVAGERYHVVAKELCDTINAYYDFIENFAKNNNLDDKFIIKVGKKYYENVFPAFAKYSDQMEAIFGFDVLMN